MLTYALSPMTRAAIGDADAPPLAADGARVGRYLLVARLGAGASGVVYAAHDPELSRHIALKLLPGGDGRVVRAAQAMAQLGHPNVVTLDKRSGPRCVFSGDQLLEVDLPAGTRVIYPRPPIEALKNTDAAIRYALNHPIGSDPLHAKLRPGMKVVIAIDDISLPLPPMRRPDVRESVLTIVLEMCADHGVEDIEIIIATAVHRRMTAAEVKHIVGSTPTPHPTAPCGACRQVLNEFGPEMDVLCVCDTPETIYTGLPSLGHAAYFGIAAYVVAILATERQTGLLGCLVAALIAATVAAAVDELISPPKEESP